MFQKKGKILAHDELRILVAVSCSSPMCVVSVFIYLCLVDMLLIYKVRVGHFLSHNVFIDDFMWMYVLSLNIRDHDSACICHVVFYPLELSVFQINSIASRTQCRE